MKKTMLTLMLVFFISILAAQSEQTINRTFKAGKSLKIKAVSGDFDIRAGDRDEIDITVVYSVSPEKAFSPEFSESASGLKITERWHGSSSGDVRWTITLPKNVEIDFSSASGDLEVEGTRSALEAGTASGDVTITNAEGDIEISTASGDITIENCSGDMELSTASGDVEARYLKGEMDISTASGEIDLRDSKGEFDLSCASGDIDASGLVMEEESSFSTASGEVEVSLAESSKYDLNLSSASGDITLDYSGNKLSGTFEFVARKDRGRITSSVKFDRETEFEEYGKTYLKKTFTKEKETPHVMLETSTGRIIFKH